MSVVNTTFTLEASQFMQRYMLMNFYVMVMYILITSDNYTFKFQIFVNLNCVP